MNPTTTGNIEKTHKKRSVKFKAGYDLVGELA